MSDQTVLEPIRSFLSRSFESRQMRDDEDIFALGFGNSLFAMQLVDFLEREYGIEIDSEDLELKNFQTVRAIGDLVNRKLSARHAQA